MQSEIGHYGAHLLTHYGAHLLTHYGAHLLAHYGAHLLTHYGAHLLAHYGAHLLTHYGAHLLAHYGAHLLAHYGAHLLAHYGAHLLTHYGAHLLTHYGAHLLAHYGAHLLAHYGAHLLTHYGAHLLASILVTPRREIPRPGCNVNWSYFRPSKFKTYYLAPQFFIFRRTVQIAPNFLHWNAHIFLFWLNPTGHSKLHNTSNTLRLLPIPVGLLVLPCTRQCRPPPPPYSQRKPVPVPVTGVRYNSLLWMCMLNTLTWPDLTCSVSMYNLH